MTNNARKHLGEVRPQTHEEEPDVTDLETLQRAAAADLATRIQDQECRGTETFVCYMDTEGFRSKVRANPAELFGQLVGVRRRLLSSMTTGVVTYTSGTKTSYVHEPAIDLLWPMVFSDSWFMSTRSGAEEDFERICIAAALLFVELAKIGLPAKGAISSGSTWWSWHEQTVLGEGVTRAYELAEGIDVFGIAVDPRIGCDEGSIITGPLRVPLKRAGHFRRLRLYRDLSFVRLVVPPPRGLGPDDIRMRAAKERRDGMRRAFTELETAYRAGAAPKRSVLRRYRRSRRVLEATISDAT